MEKETFLKRLELKSAIRLLISGWVAEEKELYEALEILEEVRNDYKEEIKRQSKN